MKAVNPPELGSDPKNYAHGVLVEPLVRTLYISGQVGLDANGVVSPDFLTEARTAWRNVEAVLASAGMSASDIVKTTIFLVRPEDYSTFVEVRRDVLKGHRPASTLVFVSRLVDPAWKVEIEAVAIKQSSDRVN